jgi:hypothetical protein
MDDRLFPIDDVKRCSKCRQLKPLREFNQLRKARDGRQSYCRDCNKAYHYLNWDKHMAQIRARKKRLLAQNRSHIIDYLSCHPCVDCGETDIVVLEFDHLRDKKANVSLLVATGFEWRRILEEIAKCDVVCANCHRRRTARRARTYRHRAVHDP